MPRNLEKRSLVTPRHTGSMRGAPRAPKSARHEEAEAEAEDEAAEAEAAEAEEGTRGGDASPSWRSSALPSAAVAATPNACSPTCTRERRMVYYGVSLKPIRFISVFLMVKTNSELPREK